MYICKYFFSADGNAVKFGQKRADKLRLKTSLSALNFCCRLFSYILFCDINRELFRHKYQAAEGGHDSYRRFCIALIFLHHRQQRKSSGMQPNTVQSSMSAGKRSTRMGSRLPSGIPMRVSTVLTCKKSPRLKPAKPILTLS